MSTPTLRIVEGNTDSPALLPRSLEAERIVLGVLLLRNDFWPSVAPILEPIYFSEPLNGEIYRAIRRIIERGRQATPGTVGPYIKDNLLPPDVTVTAYLVGIVSAVVTEFDVKEHAETILDLFHRRETIQTLQAALQEAFNPNLDKSGTEITADAIAELEVISSHGAFQFRTARQVRLDAVDKMKLDLPCTPTGYPRMDRVMGGGLLEGTCYGLIARMKAGKTLLAGGIAYHTAGPESDVLYISAEMGSERIEQRAWAAEMGVNSMDFLRKKTRGDPNFIASAAERAIYANEHLHYAHVPFLELVKLRRILTQFTMQFPNATGFILDYIQLVKGAERGENSVAFGDRVAQWLANFCAESKLWGLILAQSNQEGNVRFGEGLRQACDMCLVLSRTQDGQGNEAWLNMIDSRYTPYQDVGSESDPAFKMNVAQGPFYEEIPALVNNNLTDADVPELGL